MNIRTVAVFSAFDRGAPYTALADEAVPIGPEAPARSYLNLERIMEAADQTDVNAIHPGYGFLAENPSFPDACESEGRIFIGPPSDAIEAVGNKVNARDLLRNTSASGVPGTVLSEQDPEEARSAAQEIGFPVLIKAAAGGGGKGMRVIHEPGAFMDAFEEARGEAETAFGDPEVFLEKYFTRPRHVEIQVLLDQHGNALHLGERECSIQRRHQKLIEEAPSPALSPELRREMGEAALEIVREAGYENAGTVEFLLDREQNFYFLEVNTRLQVEHPVTEYLTGVDLVEEQVNVARGEELSVKQFENLSFRGAAIECRICAEDPESDFMPDTGIIQKYNPPSGPFTRFDSGVEAGSEIGMSYDSMMGKLITWGGDRQKAHQRMRRALTELTIVGVQTTIPLYLDILDDPDFSKGRFSTNYLDHFDRSERDQEREQFVAALAAAIERSREEGGGPAARSGFSPASSGERSETDRVRRDSNWFRAGLRRQLDHD